MARSNGVDIARDEISPRDSIIESHAEGFRFSDFLKYEDGDIDIVDSEIEDGGVSIDECEDNDVDMDSSDDESSDTSSNVSYHSALPEQNDDEVEMAFDSDSSSDSSSDEDDDSDTSSYHSALPSQTPLGPLPTIHIRAHPTKIRSLGEELLSDLRRARRYNPDSWQLETWETQEGKWYRLIAQPEARHALKMLTGTCQWVDERKIDPRNDANCRKGAWERYE